MAHRQSRSEARQRGSARDAQVRDRSNLHSASNHAHRSPANHDNTTRNANSGRRRKDTDDDHSSDRLDHGYDGAFDADPPQDNHPCNTSQEHQHYQILPRPWESQNSKIVDAINNPFLQEGMVRFEGSPNHDYYEFRQRSSTKQPDPMPNGPQFQPESSERHAANSRPLGASNLRDLNQNRTPTHAMERQWSEDQRAGPYNAIGYVGRRSVYDDEREEFVRYRREEASEQYHHSDEYEEYDDRSSETLY